jgi:hypothetical protein
MQLAALIAGRWWQPAYRGMAFPVDCGDKNKNRTSGWHCPAGLLE